MVNKMESILNTIKKMLGLDSEYTDFDIDIITDINMVFSTLNQLGVGPEEGFLIIDENQKWSDYEVNPTTLGFVKTYIYLKVKQIFDPGNNAINSAIETQIKELESRMNFEVD